MGRDLLVRRLDEKVRNVLQVTGELEQTVEMTLALFEDLIESLETLNSNGGLQVIHLGVEPKALEIEVDVAIGSAVRLDRTHDLLHLVIIRNDHSTLSAADQVGGVEAEGSQVSERADRPTAVAGTVGFAGILDNRQVMPCCDLEDGVHLTGLPHGVDDLDRTGARRDGLLDPVWIDVQRLEFDVDKTRVESSGQNRIARRDERAGRNDDLIPSLRAFCMERSTRDEARVGSRAHGYSMAVAEMRCKSLLEIVDVLSLRNPIFFERGVDALACNFAYSQLAKCDPQSSRPLRRRSVPANQCPRAEAIVYSGVGHRQLKISPRPPDSRRRAWLGRTSRAEQDRQKREDHVIERIFITGGAGYVGSVLVGELLRDGHSVTVLDNFLFAQTSLLEWIHDPRLRVVRGDARDESLVRELVSEADVVIPLACLTGAPLCDRDPDAARAVILDGIDLILGMLSKQQRILYPTTNSGYGIGEEGIHCDEESPLRPISLYGRLKVEAEKRILDSGNGITFRLATAFGISPRMRLDLLVNDFTWRAVTDRFIVLFEAHNKRNFIHVRDIARVFAHGIKHYETMKGESFNVGLDDANLSKLELCEVIRREVPEFVWSEAPVGEDPDKRNYIVSNAKIGRAGFKPQVSLEQGIAELVRGFPILRQGHFSNV